MRAALTGVLAGALLMTACVEPGVTDLDDVRTDLAREGAVVRTIDTTLGFPFSVGATRLDVDGVEIRVLEYESVAAREADSSAIGMGGYSVHGMPIEWTGPPQFWADGRVLVVHTGTQESIIDLLSRVLGPPLAVDSG